MDAIKEIINELEKAHSMVSHEEENRISIALAIDDAIGFLKAKLESEEEAGGTLDKLIKETRELLAKAPTDFDVVKGIIERSSLRKHFDEATIETGERIITLRHGADEVDLLFDKDGRIE